MVTAPTGRATEIREVPPEHCPSGHPLRPPNVAVAHLPCGCVPAGHRTYTCGTCGATVHDPPHTDDEQLVGREYGR